MEHAYARDVIYKLPKLEPLEKINYYYRTILKDRIKKRFYYNIRIKFTKLLHGL